MFGWWKDKRVQRENANKLYNACVKQARNPVFYQELQIDDTLEMRFEMICLHASFVMEWLYNNDQEKLAQKLFDVMFVDIDRNLRESGVGDLAVPKRIKKMMKGFKGRFSAYRDGDEKKNLNAAIERNLEVTNEKHVKALSDYIMSSFTNIKLIDIEDGLIDPIKLFTGIENEQKTKKRSAA